MSETVDREGRSAPVARTAIEPGVAAIRSGWVVEARRSVADLVLSDEGTLAKVLVKGPVTGGIARVLGASFGRAAHTTIGGAPVLAVGSGPGEWLVLGSGAGGERTAAVRAAVDGADDVVSVIDLTHGRALVRLSGRRATSVLETICAIDLAESVVPDGASFRSSVASVVTDVVRDDRSGTPSFLLHCERSTGQFLAEAILDAGEEHGIETTSGVGVDPAR